MLDPFLVEQFAQDDAVLNAAPFIDETVQRLHQLRQRRTLMRATMILLAASFGVAGVFGGGFTRAVEELPTSAAAFGHTLGLPWVWALTVVVLLSVHGLARTGHSQWR